MSKHRKVFAPIEDTERQLVDMAFNKKRADERKEWLKTCTSTTFMDTSGEIITVKDFINKELILFSMADNVRSIPSVIDGLKPGHRKILFSCFKRKLKGEIKVAQLSGYVAEHSAYHHGEQSLCGTIIGMAQNFVGSNNVNLLEPIGQFGTRLQGGKDAASPRYVFTSLSPFARLLFRTEDDALLKYLDDDGQSIEPEWYIPVLPLVLVNGCEGIGTGWMTTIPSFNPCDVVNNLLRMMRGEVAIPMHPWYHGFTGEIETHGSDRYMIRGIWNRLDDMTVEITELPIGTWTQNYKETLEGMLSASTEKDKLITDYKEYHTDTTVRFLLTLSEEGMRVFENGEFEKRFKMSTFVNINNIVCFDKEGRLRKYSSPLAILEDFYHLRLEYYVKRKEWMADQLTKEWTRLDNRVRFVQEIIDGKLIVQNRKKADILVDLLKRGYVKDPTQSKVVEVNAEEGSDVEESSGTGRDFDYLLGMPIYSLTKEKVEKLLSERAEKEAELNRLLARTPKDLWRSDLDEFLASWDEHVGRVKEITETERAKALGKVTTGRKGSTKTTKSANVKKSTSGEKKKKTVQSDEESDEEFSVVSDDEGKPGKKVTTTTTTTTTKRVISARNTKRSPQVSDVEEAMTGKKTKTASTSQTPILDEDAINSLPLAERINYMLQQRIKQSTLDQHVKPSTRRIILSDDDE